VKYIVEMGGGGDRVEVELDGAEATVDGASVPARLSDVPGTPVRLVQLGATVHRVVARRQPGRGRYTLWVDGYRYEVEALDERTRAIQDMVGAAAAATGPAPLTAPMPGLVVRVQVAEGDLVQPGQAMVVMEAMKMENELRATASGVVTRVLVAPGTAVEKGALLVELADPSAGAGADAPGSVDKP